MEGFFELNSFVLRFKMMVRRFLFGLLLISVVCGCRNTTTKSDDSSTYTIATLKGPSSMGMIRLIDSLSKMDNNSVQVKILNEPIQVRKMMIEGSADFAILPTTMAAIVYNKGLEYQLVSIPVWGTLYLVGSDSTIKSWEDLRGKRVHIMAKGMTPDVFFRFLLQKNGIDPDKDITLDYSFPTHIDLANAVAARQAEIGVISEPMVSLTMQKNKTLRRIFDLNEEWRKQEGAPIAETAFMGKKSLLQHNPLMVEKLISSYAASTKWVNQNPDSAAVLIVKYNILPDSEVAIIAIPGSNLKFVRAKEIKKQIEEYLNVFYKMNPEIIGGKIPDENFYY